MKNRLPLVILFLLFVSPLFSWEVRGIEGRMGLVWYGFDGETEYTVSPLKATLGAAVPMKISSRFEFHPELEMFYFDYVWVDSEERAVPAAIETANRILVFHFLINPSFLYTLPLDSEDRLSLGFSLSPAFLFRVPLTAADDGADTRKELSGYLYSAGRFFYPSVGGLFTWRYRERLIFTLAANVYIPLFNLWAGTGAAFYDQMIITSSAGFRIPLK